MCLHPFGLRAFATRSRRRGSEGLRGPARAERGPCTAILPSEQLPATVPWMQVGPRRHLCLALSSAAPLLPSSFLNWSPLPGLLNVSALQGRALLRPGPPFPAPRPPTLSCLSLQSWPCSLASFHTALGSEADPSNGYEPGGTSCQLTPPTWGCAQRPAPSPFCARSSSCQPSG